MRTDAILSLQGVNKSFGPIDVLHDINLKIKAGGVLCLLGDNGAGKPTVILLSGGTNPHPVKSLWTANRSALPRPATPPTTASPPSTNSAAPSR